MSNDRKIEFDVEAIMLASLCVFLWLSLISYDGADAIGPLPSLLKPLISVDHSVFPANEQIQNWCGWFGAFCATLLVQALGIGSVLIVCGLSLLSVWMFRVQSNYVAASRQLGWVLVVVAISTFVTLLNISTPLSPVIGAGGYLGALTSTWLNDHFALLGSLILTMAVLFAGLLLSTDYVVLRTLGWILSGGTTVARTAASATKKRVVLPGSIAEGKPRQRSDVDDEISLQEQEDSAEESFPSIRIRRKPKASQATDTTESVSESGLLATLLSPWASLWRRKPKTDLDEATPVHSQRSVQDVSNLTEPAPEEVHEAETEEVQSDYRDVEIEDETLHVRGDQPHAEEVPQPAAVKVKNPKSKKAEKAAVTDSLAHMDDTKLPSGTEEYVLPGNDLLLESDDIDFEEQAIEVRRKAKILEKTFKDFGFNVRVVEIETGPVIAQYEVELEAGLRLSKITGLADDLAIALRVPSVRIVAPIPGKNTVGIEIPNEDRQVVRLREVIEEQGAKGRKAGIPLFLGKDVSGNPLTADLSKLPHLLIAGRTGTGKSVCLNAIIASILMTRRPDEVRMLMIDPKMVELSGYGRLPHLMHPVVTDMKKAEAILAWAVDKMEERYALLARAGVRHISSYNELGREELLDRIKVESDAEAEHIPDHLPFIVIVADEMADLMMTAGKEVEQHIIRLAQKSRAVGIHLILATQKPTVDVITGLIKSNLPARIAFQVASRTDSRVVLDEMGADKLLGNGDMLFLWPGTSMLLRGQGTFLSDEEINAIVDHCSTGEQNFVNELVNLKIKEDDDDEAAPAVLKKRDDLYAAAVDVVVREGRGSCSLLQRALGIGYGRAARLIDYMAEDGIVGQYNGSQAREVIISMADWESMQAGEEGVHVASTDPPVKPQSRNKIRPHDDESSDDGSVSLAVAGARAGIKSAGQTQDEREDVEDVEDVEDEELDAADDRELDTRSEESGETNAIYEDDEVEYEDYE